MFPAELTDIECLVGKLFAGIISRLQENFIHGHHPIIPLDFE